MNLETLEEGINYCIEEAAEYRWKACLYDTDDEYGFVHAHMCEERAEDYSQLAAWLTELRKYREQFSKSSMRVNSDNCEDKSNGATNREIELQQIIQNQKIYIAQLKAKICDSSEYCAYCDELDMSEHDHFTCKYKKKKIPAVCYWQVLTPTYFDDIPWTKSDKSEAEYD